MKYKILKTVSMLKFVNNIKRRSQAICCTTVQVQETVGGQLNMFMGRMCISGHSLPTPHVEQYAQCIVQVKISHRIIQQLYPTLLSSSSDNSEVRVMDFHTGYYSSISAKTHMYISHW